MDNLGKLPPQSIQSELYTIGAILLEKDSLLKVIDFLKHEHFYKHEYQIIYKIIIDLFTEGKNYDTFIIIEELKRGGLLDEVGGPRSILSLTEDISSASRILEHAQYITEAFMKREIINTSLELEKMSYDDNNIESILEFATDKIISIDNSIQQNQLLDIETALDQSIDELQEPKRLIKTGFAMLDESLRIRNQNLILLAARPSQGKTALALNIAYNISKNIPVGLFSLEMSFTELSYRLLSNVSSVPFDHFLHKLSKPSLELVKQGSQKIKSENKIFIDDSGGLTITKLRSKITELTIKHKVGFIIIDYLQLMTSSGENQNVRIGNLSRDLKILAKHFNIPILALSQLSRKIEDRTNKRPVLSDLRDSGSLEQDADTVLFLTNFEKSKIYENESGPIPKGICSIDCEKQRNGITFNSELIFTGKYQRFEDVSQNFSDIQDIDF